MKSKWLLSLQYNIVSLLKEKSFWITNLILVAVLAGNYFFVTYMQNQETKREHNVLVVNETSLPISVLMEQLPKNRYTYKYESTMDKEKVKKDIADEKLEAAFHIYENGKGNQIAYYDDVEDLMLKMTMMSVVSQVNTQQMILQSGLPETTINKILTPPTVSYDSVLSEKKEQELNGALLLNFIFSFILYFFSMVYPQMMAMSLISAKGSRATESLFTRITPTQYLFGKIGGIITISLIQLTGLLIGATAIFSLNDNSELAKTVIQSLTLGHCLLFVFAYFLLVTFTSCLHTIFSSFITRIEDYTNLNFVAMILPMIGFFVVVTITSPSDFTDFKAMLGFIPAAGIYILVTGVLFGKLSTVMVMGILLAQIIYVMVATVLAGKMYKKLMFAYELKFSWKLFFKMLKKENNQASV